MHTSALEEAALTQDNTKPEPELPAPTPQSETQEQEPTAVVPTEPDIIEGEVIVLEVPGERADHIPPKHKPYWVCIPFTILVCFSIVAVSLLVPVFSPSATVTLIPVERTITTLAAIQVQGRQLPPLTLMQSSSVAATGKRHRAATRAVGTITFYNGQFFRQTIAAGTVLTGADGVQVETDQPAGIPAANPPYIGQVTVSAHAIHAGQMGNVQAGDINEQCCLSAVKAVNSTAFQGGQNARDYNVVTREDIRSAASPLQTTLSQSERAALEAQLYPNEQLITPSCMPHVSSDHKPGDEAKTVTVTVSETCSGIGYAAHEVYANATQLITSQARSTLGADYALVGDIQVTIVHATITNSCQGRAHIIVQIAGTWVYQITPPMQQHLAQLLAGKPKQQAITILLQFPGIKAASIQLAAGNTTVPANSNDIHLIVMYRSSY